MFAFLSDLWLLVLAAALVALWRFRFKPRDSSLPPGPISLPIVGSLFSLRTPLHQCFASMSSKYGPIIYLKIGIVPHVVVNTAKAAEDILRVHDAEFSGRPAMTGWSKFFSFQGYDMFFCSCPRRWKALRTATNMHLFSNTMLNSTSHIRQAELQILLDSIHHHYKEGKPINMRKAFAELNCGSICKTLFGANWDMEVAVELVNLIEAYSGVDIGGLIPALDWLDLHGVNKKMGKQLMPHMKSLLEKTIFEHRESKAKAGTSFVCKDFTDVLISLEDNPLEDISIVALLSDMLIAGLDTTAIALEWAMAEIVNNPQIMLKAQEEVDRVVGRSGHVKETDLSNLPYVHAIMKESFRLHTPGPLGVPHFNQSEVKLGEYIIPAGCSVMVNIWAIGRDEAYWSEPTEFRPERFLESDVSLTGQDFQLIPFSAGRRMCAGYTMPMRFIPLVLATLLHQFEWRSVEARGISIREAPTTLVCKLESELVVMAVPR